jgi:hypothetical protein
MSASGKPEIVSIRSRDYYFKASGWETWVLIEPADDGTVSAHFIDEESAHFGELVFTSIEKALEALRRNEFVHYTEQDNNFQSIYRPPSPPFRRIICPNLLYSIFWTDIAVSETDTLQTIAAILKKYEPAFELEGAFTPGVRGRADPRFFVTRAERLRLLAVRKRDNSGVVSLHESFADISDHVREDGAEADPRINWRVTARHGDYYIHIMALDQGLSRFACCLQTTSEFEEGLQSYGRCLRTRYEAGNLAEIEHVLDDIYARLKHWEEQRRQREKHEEEQRRQQDRIDKEVQKAVEKEREIWRDRLARFRNKVIVSLACGVAVAILVWLWFGLGCTLDDEEGICAGVGGTLFSGVGILILFVIALCEPWWNRQKSRWRNWRYQRWNERQLRKQIYVLYDGKLYIKSAAGPFIVAFDYLNPPRFADAVEARAWLKANNELGNVVER